MATDPVCGMRVDEKTAEQSKYAGKTFYFCSKSCKEEFDANPEQYAQQTTQQTQQTK